MTVSNNIRKMNRSKSILFSLLGRILNWDFPFALWKVTLRIIGDWRILRFARMIFLPFCLIRFSLTFGGMIVLSLWSGLSWMCNEGWFSLFAFGFFFTVFLSTLGRLSHLAFPLACWSRRSSSFSLVRFGSGGPAFAGASFVRFGGTSFLDAYSFRIWFSDVLLSFLNRSSHSVCSLELTVDFLRLNSAFRFICEVVMTFFKGLPHRLSSFYRALLFLGLPLCLLFIWFFLQSFFLDALKAWTFLFWGRNLFLRSIGASFFTFGGRCAFFCWFTCRPFLFRSFIESLRVAIFEVLIKVDNFGDGSMFKLFSFWDCCLFCDVAILLSLTLWHFKIK